MRALLAILAVGAVLATIVPAAGADPVRALPGWGGGGIGVGVPSTGQGASPCGTAVAGGQGSPSGPSVCAGGMSFVGPTTGQIASVIGPTIISPAVVGTTIIVSSGSNIVAPGAF